MNTDSSQSPPTLGRVSLVMFVRTDCSDRCYEGYAALQQIVKRFPDLEVTLVTNTGGYYRTNLVPPDVEASLVRDYFRDTLRITQPMAILESSFDRRASDGRLLIKKNPNTEAYQVVDIGRTEYGGPITFIVDKQNIIRWKTALSWRTATSVNNLIKELSQ